ncbi:hypothetical protein BH11PLA1_BH11PLA1_12610 [soil metagenome]
MHLSALLDTLIAAIAVGSLYALVALGYTLVYGVLKFINFAHSDIFVLGAWTSFTVATVAQAHMAEGPAPWWLGVLVLLSAVAVCGLMGYLIERFAYRPLRKSPRLNVLITAIGVSLLLQNVGQLKGIPVARERVQSTVEVADLKPEDKPFVISTADGVATLERPGDATATVPFGPTPKNMPTLLPDAVLNETTVAAGKIAAGRMRGTVTLDQPITIMPDREYALEVERFEGGAVKRTRLGLLAEEPGEKPAGEVFRTQPPRGAKELDGATYRLVLAPLVPIRLLDVLIVSSSLILMVALQLLVFKTKMGQAMRALSFNTETAALMGINTNFVISFTFILGTALAACAAFLYVQRYPGLNQAAAGIWVLLGLKAFVAAVVGGIGNVRGAVLGGFLIALIEFMGALAYAPYRDVYVFGILILVLLLKPNGLLGAAVRVKV